MIRSEIISYLSGVDDEKLFATAAAVKSHEVGNKVYLRGLIELSNRCRKNCYYCGIRAGNANTERYMLDESQVIAAATYAYRSGYGSVVLQAGEQQSQAFIDYVADLIGKIKALSNGKLGITISLGEQTEETYRRWFEAGAHRYLLRIESSNEAIYTRIHPADHLYGERLECLEKLRRTGYQLGTGVMIGIPGQTVEDLADDLLFLQKMDIDMCGMGPYIEHPDAPLGASDFTREERYRLALRMIALLRILMPNINIASTTALHALQPQGREAGVAAGANIIMPNITPADLRVNYKLYDNKPMSDIDLSGFDVALGEWGDSKHFTEK